MAIPSGTLSPSLDLEKRQIARAALQPCRPLVVTRAFSSALQRRRDRRFADTTEPSPLARSQSRPAVELRSESRIG